MPYADRWATVMQRELGADYRVIEEGLTGRLPERDTAISRWPPPEKYGRFSQRIQREFRPAGRLSADGAIPSADFLCAEAIAYRTQIDICIQYFNKMIEVLNASVYTGVSRLEGRVFRYG